LPADAGGVFVRLLNRARRGCVGAEVSDFFTRRLLSDLCSASQVERASNCDERWGSCVNLAQRARDYTGLFIRQSEDAEAYRAWLEHDLRQAMLDGHGGKTQGLMMLVH
jgi:hypothetical protein